MTGSKNEEEDDELSPYIGQFGRWHFLIYFVVAITDFPSAMITFNMTFYTPTVDFWCARPENLGNVSIQEWRNFSSPPAVYPPKTSDGQCVRYDVDYKNISESGLMDIFTNKTTPCNQWEYDLGIYKKTMIEEFDLVCGQDILISTSNAIFMAGFMIGVLVFGHIADIIGRRKVMLINTFIVTGISTVMIFSQSFPMFMILRGFQILFRIGAATTGIVLFLENCPESHRAMLGNTIFWGFTIGMTAFAGIAYGLRNWVHIQIIIVVQLAVSVILIWFIPESPRWLITKGRLDEATKELKRAAAINHIDLTGKEQDLRQRMEYMHQKEVEAQKGKKTYTLFDLLKLPNMRKKTLNLCFCWAVNAFVYYGLSFNTNNLGGDPFINFFIAAAVEIPAMVMASTLGRYVGRKTLLMTIMVIGGLSCASPIVIPRGMTNLRIAFPMIGKLCISASFTIIYVYSAEIFPTVARNTGVGSCSMIGRVGSILAPYVKELEIYTNSAVPLAVYGLLCVSSGLLLLLLPETKGRILPDTLSEAELITRKNQSMEALKDKDEMEMKALSEVMSNGTSNTETS